MKASVVLPLLLVATVCLGAEPPSTAPAKTPGSAEGLAVASLVYSARSLGHLRDPSAVAQTGRIRVLLQYAERLWPDSVQTNRQLMDLYEGLGDPSRAARAARQYLLARPNDYAVGLRWIRLSQAGLDRAEQRIELLQAVAADERFAKEIRAAAAAELSGVYLAQSDKGKAQQACRQALGLDPYHVGALEAMAGFGGQAGAVELLRNALTLLRANPRSMQSAWTVARLLQQGGLYSESLDYYGHAYGISRARRPARKVMEPFLTDYFNAMLDAGLTAEACEQFEPLVKRYGWSLALRALMVEACRALKKDDAAKEHTDAMEEIYKPLSAPGARRSGEQAAELAWFYLAFKSQPKVALQWAQEAAGSAGNDPFVQRVLGAAELAAGKAEDGLARLMPLAAKDPHAALRLARYYLSTKEDDKARQILKKYDGKLRGGMGWRELAALAADNKMPLPPAPDVEALRGVLKQEPAHVLEMGLAPERFVTVNLTALRGELAVGEPVEITVELENTSTQPVPLGRWGLFDPVVFLSVSVNGQGKAELPNLVSVPLPAPKYLAPGEKVSQTARVDVGAAEQLLADRPLADLKLTVTAMVDPLQAGQEMFSSVPDLKVAPVTIRRKPLFDAAGGQLAARYALGYIVRDLRQGDPPTRLRAARQTAALLAHVRRVEMGNAQAVFPEVLTKPVLLSMTRAFLQADSPLVRAEMLAALHQVPLDRRIISLMGGRVEDDSPLVRLRLIELLAGQRTPGHEGLLDLYAKDSDELVREMALVLRKK